MRESIKSRARPVAGAESLSIYGNVCMNPQTGPRAHGCVYICSITMCINDRMDRACARALIAALRARLPAAGHPAVARVASWTPSFTHPCRQTAAILVVTVARLEARARAVILVLLHEPVVESLPREAGVHYETVA